MGLFSRKNGSSSELPSIEGTNKQGKSVSDESLPTGGKSVGDSKSSSTTDLGEPRAFGGDTKNVFSDAELAEFYAPIDEYEGKHRFDPTAKWTEEEEAKLVKRVGLSFAYKVFTLVFKVLTCL